MTISQHKIGTNFCTPQLISRRSVIYQVGFCIKAVLFCHKTMDYFSVDVVEMSTISDFPTQTLRGAERRDVRQHPVGLCFVSPHHTSTQCIAQFRKQGCWEVGIESSEEGICTAILKHGISSCHHGDYLLCGFVIDVMINPLEISIYRSGEARSGETQRGDPFRTHFWTQRRVTTCKESARLFHTITVEFVNVWSAPRCAEVGEDIELRQQMIVCTSRVGEVGVVRQTAVIFSKNVFSARIKCLSICAHPKFCTPIASGVFLNTKNT